jgi:hypothetical protein
MMKTPVNDNKKKLDKRKQFKLCLWLRKNKIFPSPTPPENEGSDPTKCCSIKYFYGICKCNK